VANDLVNTIFPDKDLTQEQQAFKILIEKALKKHQEPETPYSAVLDITEAKNLNSDVGWKLTFVDQAAKELFKQERTQLNIGISGLQFDCGKTFVLKKLTGSLSA
jgi:hypothetical protein